MAQFQATVRIYELTEHDGSAARRTVEERLRAAGFNRWRIVNIGVQGATTPTAPRPPMPARVSYAGGGLLVAGITAWALWFLYLLGG